MKRMAVIGVWVLAALLFVAVLFTAGTDHLRLIPVKIGDTPSTTATVGLRINLNTATSEELQQLSGIGEVLASRILEYREVCGPFQSVDDLLDISGIGEKRLAEWRDYLPV